MLPQLSFVEAFVTGCLRARRFTGAEIDAEVGKWATAWRRLSGLGRSEATDQQPPTLARADTPPSSGDRDRVELHALPRDLGDFTGRAIELAQLLNASLSRNTDSAVTVIAIDGMAGVGKTVLAVHVGHLLAADYPDAQLFIDLRAHMPNERPREPTDALEALLRAIGVPPDRIPSGVEQRALMWRSKLVGRRILIVLDNVASTSQVRPLLPGAPGCLVLVTSRRRLTGLDASQLLQLNVFEAPDATALFARIAGDHHSHREPTAVDDVVSLCGHLPLAVRIAAARLRHRPAWHVADLKRRLCDERHRLAELCTEDQDITAAFSLSYQHLDPGQQRLFRLIALPDGPDISAPAAAALGGLDTNKAERLLEDLVDHHLLEEPEPGRYRMHDLLREFATVLVERTDSTRVRKAAVRRLLDWYVHTSHSANKTLMPNRLHVTLDPIRPSSNTPLQFPTHQDAMDWCNRELANLVIATRLAADSGEHAIAWKLPATLWGFFYLSTHWAQWFRTHHIGLTAARQANDSYGEAWMLHSLGTRYWDRQHPDRALTLYHQALAIWAKIPDRWGEAQTLNNLGAALCAQRKFAQAQAPYKHALELRRTIGDRRGEAQTLSNLGELHRELHMLKQATRYFQQALTIHIEIGDHYGQGITLHNLGKLQYQMRNPNKASELLQRALKHRKAHGDQLGTAETLHLLGKVEQESGQVEKTREHWQQALAIFAKVNDPQAKDIHEALQRMSPSSQS
jgi:tetratricopeptide (TPR) repeat protein